MIVSENFGIDSNSVELFWWVASGESETIKSGSTQLELDGVIDTGLRLEFIGVIDLSKIEGNS